MYECISGNKSGNEKVRILNKAPKATPLSDECFHALIGFGD